MLSSTSSSNSTPNRPTRRDAASLILACALVCIVIEGGAMLLFRRVSHIERRRETEYRAALGIRQGQDAHQVSVLLAGNSLLLEGVDLDRLQQDVGPDLAIRRVAIENTSYLDWYYGLRRVFKLGAHPDVVVLVLNPLQLISRSTDADYTAHLLLDGQDVLRLAKDTGADRNRLSSMVLANASYFYGTRAEIRTWILGRLIPGLPSLTRFFHRKASMPGSDTIREIGINRLSQLNQLCRTHNAKLVVVIPPTPENWGTNEVLQSGADSGVVVVLPVSPSVLTDSDYSDGFHLSSKGAAVFTTALARDLRQSLLVGSILQRETAHEVLPAAQGVPASVPVTPAYSTGNLTHDTQ